MQGAGLLPAASEQPQAQIAATEQARAQMQQWARFPLYLTQDVWNILQGSSERQLRKVECVTSHLVTLGLRNPSERTMATVAAVIAQCDGQNMEDPDTAKQVALLSTVKSVDEDPISSELVSLALRLGEVTCRNCLWPGSSYQEKCASAFFRLDWCSRRLTWILHGDLGMRGQCAALIVLGNCKVATLTWSLLRLGMLLQLLSKQRSRRLRLCLLWWTRAQ